MGTKDIRVRVTGELRNDVDVQLIAATIVEIALEFSAQDEEPKRPELSRAAGRTDHDDRKADGS
ncbi:hypothetical protein GCM10027447_07730 [Glycomyces halotolerans]